MSFLERCKARARSAPRRLVLPEGHDERIVAAARRLKDEGLARPVVLGEAA
jgi:phosphotransacetylase